MARDLSNAIVATPNQASTVFGVGGAHPIRQKSLFALRFLRKAGEGGAEWKDGLSFIVKQIDRPTVQPTVEEINQYNRKRIIHTGVKYSPVNCSVYDTADGSAMNMWVQYASYYFGDYRQDASSYHDDIINETMLDRGAGFGYGITSTSTSDIDGANSQFFFDMVEVFQVWGGEYTAYQLLNPRISNFDPDDLDYEQTGLSMIQMTLNYEGIYHVNGGKPQLLSTNQTLVELFGGTFSGETFDPEPSARRETSFVSAPAPAVAREAITGDIDSLLRNADEIPLDIAGDRSDTTTSFGGALNKYGSFNFGDFDAIQSNLPSEISLLSGKVPLTTKQANEMELARITAAPLALDGIQSALKTDFGYSRAVVFGINDAAVLQGTAPADQISRTGTTTLNSLGDDVTLRFAFDPGAVPSVDDPRPAPTDATVISGNQRDNGGLVLSPLAIASINARSNGRNQIGQRTNAPTNPLLAFIREPQPASQLTPELVYGRVKLPFKIGLALEGTAFPPTLRGTVAATVKLRTSIIGVVPVNGTIIKTIPLKITTAGFAKPNGLLRGTFKITAAGAVRVVPFNYGTINRQIVIRFSNDAGDVVGVNDQADQFSTGNDGDLLGY